MKPLITMVVPYYRQPQMLAKQLENWYDYTLETQDAFKLIFVDDGSPEPAEEVVRPFVNNMAYHGNDPEVYRIDEDVPWNRSMARNLGTLEATTPWVLHVDTDHVLPPESAKSLVQYLTPPSDIFGRCAWYRFDRFRVGAADETRQKDKIDPNATFAKIHPHIDSYVCRTEAYWKAGGYNEDFSGVLGGGSPFLKEMVRANGEPVVLPIPLHVYTRSVVKDSSEHTLSRDPKLFMQRKREIIAKHGTLKGRGVKAALRLPWHKVF